MEEIKLTPQEVQQSISAAYDSVKLINDLKLKSDLSEQELDMLERNQQHIGIMLAKDWFVEGLTETQKTELNLLKK